MRQLNWSDRGQFALAWLLVKFGRLTCDDFTEQELDALIAPYFPRQFPLNVPIGNAVVELTKGQVKCVESKNRLVLQSLASLQVNAFGAQIYRAHIMIVISSEPNYDKSSHTLHLDNISIDTLRLINDDYGLIKDATFLLSKLVPGGLSNLVGQSVLSALSLFSGGMSNQAQQYITLFLEGSMQRVLDYFRSDIEAMLLTIAGQYDIHHQMRASHWREYLFSLLGERVAIADSRLRFYF